MEYTKKERVTALDVLADALLLLIYVIWVERFNVQGSGLMNPNRLNPKELRLHRGGK
jgi:hypothetical protein